MLESNINEVETNKNDERAYASISVNPTSINFSTAAQKKILRYPAQTRVG